MAVIPYSVNYNIESYLITTHNLSVSPQGQMYLIFYLPNSICSLFIPYEDTKGSNSFPSLRSIRFLCYLEKIWDFVFSLGVFGTNSDDKRKSDESCTK